MSSYVPIYAVDFDGTLCESQWPGIGEPNTKLIEHLIKRQKQGAKIILWTCRIEERLQEAVDWCAEYGLVFDAVNDNLPENVEKYGSNCRKIWATCYIDDLAVDKEKYGLPFHPEQYSIPYEEIEGKYPIGSLWMFKVDGHEFPVRIKVYGRSKFFGDQLTVSYAGDDPHMRLYECRNEVDWFDGKLFPMEGDYEDKKPENV